MLKIQINNYPPRLHAAVICPSQGLPGLAAATIPAVLPKRTGGGRGSPWLPSAPWCWLCWGYPGPLLGSSRAGLHLTWCVHPIRDEPSSWSLGAPILHLAGSGPQLEGRRGPGYSQDTGTGPRPSPCTSAPFAQKTATVCETSTARPCPWQVCASIGFLPYSSFPPAALPKRLGSILKGELVLKRELGFQQV